MKKSERIVAVRARLAAIDAWLVRELSVDDNLMNLPTNGRGQCLRMYPSLESGLEEMECERRNVLYCRDVIRVRDMLKPGSGWLAVDRAIAVMKALVNEEVS